MRPASAGRLRVPLEEGTYRVTSRFGPRGGTQHRGIDFASATVGEDFTGAEILAPADGLVIEARGADSPDEFGWVGGFGCWIILEHDLGNGERVHTVAGHMYRDDLLVRAGEQVKAGQVIARVGTNGDSSSAHLHAEVWVPSRYTGVAVDPAPWFGLQVTP